MNSVNRSGVKRKHHALSIAEKVELLKKLDRGVPVRSVCEMYDIGSSTVYDIKKHKEKVLKFFADRGSKKHMFVKKYMTKGKSSELDQLLITWVNLRSSEGVEISGNLLKEQAKVFHEELGLTYKCDYTEGWLQRFKERHCLTFRAVCSEERLADTESTSARIDEFAKHGEKHIQKKRERRKCSRKWSCCDGIDVLDKEFGKRSPGNSIQDCDTCLSNTERSQESSTVEEEEFKFIPEYDTDVSHSLSKSNECAGNDVGEELSFDMLESYQLSERRPNDLMQDILEWSHSAPVCKEEEFESIPEYGSEVKCEGNSLEGCYCNAGFSSMEEHCSEILKLRQEILFWRTQYEIEIKKNHNLQQRNDELQQKDLYHCPDIQRTCENDISSQEDPRRFKELENHGAQKITCKTGPGKTLEKPRNTFSGDEILGDKKPATLVESYRKVYSQDRMKAMEALDDIKDLKDAGELKNQILFTIIVLAFKSSSEALTNIRSGVYKLLQVEPQEDIPYNLLRSRTNALDVAINGYLTSNVSQHDLTMNIDEVCEQISSTFSDCPAIRDSEEVMQYVQTCTRLAWALTCQTPPFIISYNSSIFRVKEHVRFPTSDNHINTIKMYYWPALLRGPGGLCVSKGIVVTKAVSDWDMCDSNLNIETHDVFDEFFGTNDETFEFEGF